MSRWSSLLSALAGSLVLALPIPTRAFCGFYVSGVDAELFNHATMVVLMREGTHTVLSMQNDYQGPPEDFAVVVPVPVVLSRDDVKTLPREVFEHVEQLSAPRLVEYWEQDPCAQEGMIGLGGIGAIGYGSGRGSGYGRGAGAPLVRVEAEFAVGEYDIVILSASDSSALETWLRTNGYRIPERAASVLRPYVEAGTKFFVARVAVDRVTFDHGRALLSPLRVHYTDDQLSLPIRLGQLNSSGTQDLIVHVLARYQRYEVANRPNVTIPTNLDLRPEARERFGEVYAALFDRTVERNPGAVVTEYAWQATSCDPCPPGMPLPTRDLASLGADVVFPGGLRTGGFGGRGSAVPRVRVQTPELRGSLSPEVVRRVVRRHINEVRFCYERQLATQPSLEGRVSIRFTIDPEGAIIESAVASSTLGDPSVGACIADAVRRWTFPAPQAGVVIVTYPFVLSADIGTGGSTYSADELVLTRLHYRYGRDGSDQDLVFRAADAIVGGREILRDDGRLEEGATPAPYNNFQARYVIRHAWEGAIDCAEPRRGEWGPPPAGATPPEPEPATNLANVPRGALSLASFVSGEVPALGLVAAADVAEPAPVAAQSPTPAAPNPPAVRPGPSGCGCRVAAAEESGGIALAIVGLMLVLARRTRPRNGRSD